MASLFTGLNTAMSGLMASQTALDITSQNISNANTPGYTRQTLNLISVGPDDGAYRIYDKESQVGNGVDSAGVTQSRDSFLDVSYRNANSVNSDWQGQSSAMTGIEDIFNEFTGSSSDTVSGLSGQMTSLLTSLQNYQNTPTDTTLPATVESSVDDITSTVRSDYNSLTDFENQQKSDLAVTINGDNTGGGVNQILNNIAQLNTQIASNETAGQQPNDLLDQRNQLLDQLSGDIDINVSEQQNGMVTVGLQNDSSHMLISADNTVTGLQLNSSQDAVYWNDGNPPSPANAATVNGGTVDGYLQIINGNGTNTGQYGGIGIAYLKQKLNDFATNFDQMLNGFAAEYKYPSAAYPSSSDPNPASTPDSVSSALVSYDPTQNAAATIAVSSGWRNDSDLFAENYTGSSMGNYLGDIIGRLNNTNDTGPVTLSSGNTYSGSIMDFADSFTGDIANSLNFMQGEANSSSTILENLNSQRQAISSVSIDEEGINIVKYQQSYDASAQLISTINQMLGTFINDIGQT